MIPPKEQFTGSATDLAWTTPEGWREEQGQGMRLISFSSSNKNEQIDCSIVSLGGMAGGIESNVVRWINQLHIPVPAEADLKTFLDRQEHWESEDRWPILSIDFTGLQDAKDAAAPSMLAAIVDREGETIFVKLAGPRKDILKNHERFKKLCLSLRARTP